VLGILMEPDEVAREHGLDGVVVQRVVEDTGAAEAGLRGARRNASGGMRLGDVILAVDGETVRTRAELLAVLEGHRVGDTVRVRLQRDPLGEGRIEEVEVELR
jgi:S1-C subfamily serine protease